MNNIYKEEYQEKLEIGVAELIIPSLDEHHYTEFEEDGVKYKARNLCDLDISDGLQKLKIYDECDERLIDESEECVIKFKHTYNYTWNLQEDISNIAKLLNEDIVRGQKGFKITCLQCGSELVIDYKTSHSSMKNPQIKLDAGYGGEIFFVCKNEDCSQYLQV